MYYYVSITADLFSNVYMAVNVSDMSCAFLPSLPSRCHPLWSYVLPFLLFPDTFISITYSSPLLITRPYHFNLRFCSFYFLFTTWHYILLSNIKPLPPPSCQTSVSQAVLQYIISSSRRFRGAQQGVRRSYDQPGRLHYSGAGGRPTK